jgi:hypothetical protein
MIVYDNTLEKWGKPMYKRQKRKAMFTEKKPNYLKNN